MLHLWSLLFICEAVSPADQITYTFPSDFLWATSTSAFQIEGATREDGRGPSVWDTFQDNNGTIAGGATADIAADSYHEYREDVKLMKDLGVKAYRMSFSWSRIFPTGRNKTNLKGVQYYHNVLDELIKNDVIPMLHKGILEELCIDAKVSYPFLEKQTLADVGGWLHPKISDWFADYAQFCFEEYGSKVSYWVTINEARMQSFQGYGHNLKASAPNDKFEDMGNFLKYEPIQPIKVLTLESVNGLGDVVEREFIKRPDFVLESQVLEFDKVYLKGVADLNIPFDKTYDDDAMFVQWKQSGYQKAAKEILNVQRSQIGRQRISMNPRKRPLDSFWFDSQRWDFVGPRLEQTIPIGPYESVARKCEYYQKLTDAEWALLDHNAYHLENLRKIRRGEL